VHMMPKRLVSALRIRAYLLRFRARSDGHADRDYQPERRTSTGSMR
jgi:hypothetical protein